MNTKQKILSALLIVLFSCTSAFSDVEITSANFPDDNFRYYITSELDSDNDGFLTSSEIELVISMDVTKREIKDLSGIEYFSALGELYCYANNLTELDVSRNSALYLLECDNNKLQKLDLSKNSELINLECELNNLTELDLGSNKNLSYVKCYGQTRSDLNVDSDDSGNYFIDLNDYVSDLSRIINPSALDSSGDVISEFDSRTGVITTKIYPAKLRYSYAISYDLDPNLSMDVTISGVVINNTTKHSGSVGSGGGCNSEYGVFSVLALIIMSAVKKRS